MATSNPFGDGAQAAAWEQGYLAGFNNPSDDPFRPFSPELLDIFKQGFASGVEDRGQPPKEGETWLDSLVEFVAEEGLLHAIGMGIEKAGWKAGGLISLVLTVVQIPSDTMLKPLEEDFEVPGNHPGATYVPVCPRDDHGVVSSNTTPDGYWIGAESEDFLSAVSARNAHGHAEAFVAICAPHDGACGPVWPVTRLAPQ